MNWTPETLTAWCEAAMPICDRILMLLVVVLAIWLGSRIPWVRFFVWLAAPSMGSLIFVSAFCIASQSMLSQESAYKYWNPYLLEAAKFLFGSFGGGFIALKAYRMTPDNPKTKETP